MKKKILILVVAFALGLNVYFLFIKPKSDEQSAQTNTQNTTQEDLNSVAEQKSNAQPEVEQPTQNPTQEYDITSPSSLSVIVNKTQPPLPADYTPADLITPSVRLRLNAGAEQMQFRSVAHEDLKAMFAAAKADGVELVFGSGYRSYALQKQFYDSYVARDGQAAADRYSARPGTSEHQTGLSFDVTSPSGTCHLEICFAELAEGKWMAKNAHKYGFILRYPSGSEAITGYQYEPWHFRYLGKDLAQKVKSSNKTLEEFFKVD